MTLIEKFFTTLGLGLLAFCVVAACIFVGFWWQEYRNDTRNFTRRWKARKG